MVEQGRRTIADREHDRDSIRVEPARGEQQRLGRRGVEPLRLINDDEDGRALGCLREQRQCRHVDRETPAVERWPDPERRSKCGSLWLGQLGAKVEHGSHQIRQA